jgi:semaphorin 6
MSPSQVPVPRPGLCYNSSSPLPDTSLHFIKDHCLMDQSVSASPSNPLFIRAGMRERFTQIAVDQQIQAADGSLYDMLYIGTDIGRVFKVAVSTQQSSDVPPTSRIIETYQVFNEPVKNLLIVKPEGSSPQLIVLSDDEVKAVPLDGCSISASAPWEGCPQCLALRSPYCGWDTVSNTCIHLSQQVVRGPTILQELLTGSSPSCPAAPPPTTTTATTGTGNK